ncbi:hypothetical protein [Methanobrevibacter curvatus]|nr:hypothetical protein [Methanobrevibacter curvatus]
MREEIHIRHIITKDIEDSSEGFSLVSLSIMSKDIAPENSNNSSLDEISANDDIELPFHNIVEGSINIAIHDVAQNDEKIRNILKEQNVITIDSDKNNGEKSELNPKTLNIVVNENKSKNAKYESEYTINLENTSYNFNDICKEVDKAFCCVIDLAGESPMSYLWLGYCHARGINAIPIYRTINRELFKNSQRRELILPFIDSKNKNLDKDDISQPHILAFDIRALWYIDYGDIKPIELPDLLSDGFSELMMRDLPYIEKNRFWNRLAHSGKIHIFTGAIQNEDLGREMVGDWDQRTVSELVRYLASSDSTVIPELKPPVYDPGRKRFISSSSRVTNKEKHSDLDYSEDVIKSYHTYVKELLAKKDCILVASADVNALTEILLAYAYSTDKTISESEKEAEINNIIFNSSDDMNKTDHLNTIIAIKDMPNKSKPRYFSKKPYFDEFNENCRGFRIGNGNIVQLPYGYQQQNDNVEWNLLAHFLLMQNPFPESQKNFIVILNGVSGPATCALAEILTGGNDEKNLQSEQMLSKINSEFIKLSKGKTKCVQGIVKVSLDNNNDESEISDQRKIKSWDWCDANATIKGNEKNKIIVPNDYNPWIFGTVK